MKRYLSAAGVLAGTAALVASSLLATAPAAHAQAGGTLVVNVVDQYNQPVSGIVQVYTTAGDTLGTDGDTLAGGPQVTGASPTYTLRPGGYAIASVTPWSGTTCAGVTPCALGGPAMPTYSGAVTVGSGETTTYTVHVTVPSITGTGAVGSPLTLQIPAALSSALPFLTEFGGPGTTTAMPQQWLRDATAIPEATGATYTPVAGDASHALSVRLTPASAAMALFRLAGISIAPFTTNAITAQGSGKTNGWYHDPLSKAKRHHLAPATPGREGGKVKQTKAAFRSHNGSILVPVGKAHGHQLGKGEGVQLTGLFRFNSASLTAKGRHQLAKLAKSMKHVKAFTCEGYADYGGATAHEQTLSQARAQAVCQVLTHKLGKHAKAKVAGYGPTRPVAVGGTAQSRTDNRRVDVLVRR